MIRSPFVVAFALSSAVFAVAQTAPATSTPKAEEADAVLLSPFVVQAEKDIGYVAQNTLAGSRLRTSLKDLGAAISPMTAEFLQDIAATNLVEAMEYGINARVETDDGRAAGPVADSYNDATRTFRIRGLPGASRTVNYFKYLGEVDIYNTGRVELSRGPNSILYGFGSPAGVVNVATKQAQTNKNSYQTVFRTDSWDGQRLTLDANLALIKNKLAVRAVYLRGRDGSWRASGHNDQDRYFLTTTWTPDRKTTIRSEFEYVTQNRFVPRPFNQVDQITVWWNLGQQTFNNFNLALTPGATGTPGLPFTATTAQTQAGGFETITTGNYVVVSDAFAGGYALDYSRFTRSQRLQPTGNYGVFDYGVLNPRATLEANWVNGDFRSKAYNFSLQREILPGLNADLGYMHQTYDTSTRNLSTWDRYGIIGDPNNYYPDGTLKPTANRYYFENRPTLLVNKQNVDQARATLAYEKSAGNLGLFRVAGLAEWSRTKNRNQTLEYAWFNGPSVTSGGAFSSDPLNANNRVYWRSYLTDLTQLLDPNYRMPGPTNVENGVTFYNAATKTTRTIYGLPINRAQGNIDYYDEDLSSLMGVGQWFALKNRVVFTAGYRTDHLKHYETDAIRDPAGIAAGNAGIWLPQMPNGNVTSDLRGRTFTAGVVGHATDWLSLFVNASKSVNTPGDIRVFGQDPTDKNPNTFAPLRDGKTMDYGFKLSLIEDRLYVTATRYKTTAHNDVGFSGFTARGDIVAIWKSLSDSAYLAVANPNDSATAKAMYEYTNRTQGYLLDSKTEGYELEIVGQPVKGWSVSLNFSQSESIRSRIASEVRAHIDQWKSLWLNYRNWSLTQSGTNTAAPTLGSFQDFNSTATADVTGDYTINSDTINERLVDVENNFFNNPYAFEGQRFIGDNKYNFNARTRYDFRTGALKGVSLGVGARWRAGRVAGAIPQYTYNSGSSLTDTWNGRTITGVRLIEAKDSIIYDFQASYRTRFNKKFDWMIQFNIDNVLDKTPRIVNNTDPRTGNATTYRYQDPRRFIVTNTLSF
jgi:outer membrane receptor protein involved in Fe transport